MPRKNNCHYLGLCLTITVPAITGKLEACGAATLVGSNSVLALVGTEAARVMPAFIDIWNAETKYYLPLKDDKMMIRTFPADIFIRGVVLLFCLLQYLHAG